MVTFGEDKQYLSAQVIVKDGVRLRLPKTTTLLAGSKVRLDSSCSHFITACCSQ